VLARAGGLTELAFPEGSVFTREELREREAEQLRTLARRIETDLAAVALADPDSRDIMTTGQTLVTQLRKAEAVGRLVIDLDAVIANFPGRDIVLRDGDQLFVPEITQEVMVLGEVQYATSHLHTVAFDREDYIQLSGGVTNRADEARTYVVRANGSVVADSGRRWFNRSNRIGIQPGDTIVVPLDTDRVRPLTAWQSITQILYNIAIAFSVIDGI
jgi:protein involved in polysaccharide export with SLBB domain